MVWLALECLASRTWAMRSAKLTCYPRVVEPAHDALCKEESKGTECSGTIYRADWSPRGAPYALTLRKGRRG